MSIACPGCPYLLIYPRSRGKDLSTRSGIYIFLSPLARKRSKYRHRHIYISITARAEKIKPHPRPCGTDFLEKKGEGAKPGKPELQDGGKKGRPIPEPEMPLKTILGSKPYESGPKELKCLKESFSVK